MTIERVVRANYPLSLLEVLVICSIDDNGTIAKAQQKVAQLRRKGVTNVNVAAFKNKPINKPHGLNVGLRHTHNEVVTIFDAEDDIHPDIFNVVNTVLLNEPVAVVQGGVQLMNYQSKWYSVLNVLEYFFWFKSRLHYHARLGMTPLGGNTVFFTREVLQRVGGWDEQDLTEDADIGIRISLLGERMRVIYDDRYVTREETPPTLSQFIKQRTRWSQGFLQTLLKGEWRRGVLHPGLADHDVHGENPGADGYHAGPAVLPAGGSLHPECDWALRIHLCPRAEADLEDAAGDGAGLPTLSVGAGLRLCASDAAAGARHQ